jgi:2,6-dihydroxypseudooxynicotine hydrolase
MMTDSLADEILTQGVHRFLADGVHYRDLVDVRAAIGTWSDWCRVWSQFAAEAARRGESALAAGHRATAARELARASLYYHYAQNFFYDVLAQKRAAADAKVATFRRAAALLDPPLERVDIPFDGAAIPGYLRLPKHVAKPAVALLLGGLDTTKEDYLDVNDLCIERGLATFAFDGPGQGEMAWSMRWRPDFERAIFAVIDYLERRPEVDAGRVGIIGRSLGGHYAPKAAALDTRLKAVVCWGVCYEVQPLAARPKNVQDGYLFMTGAPNIEAAERMLRLAINLAGLGPSIKCPMLIVHGGLDKGTPLPLALRLANEAGGVVETLIWDDAIHCCHDRSHIVRPAMADFLAMHL